MSVYLFAYGSLMNPRSLARTLPGARATKNMTLTGYRRKMNVAVAGNAYLNIVSDSSSTVTGVLIPLSLKEFSLFSSREEGYAQTTVTEHLSEPIEGTVFAFIAPDVACDLKVPLSYILTCTAGMTAAQRRTWLDETILGEIEDDVALPVYPFAEMD